MPVDGLDYAIRVKLADMLNRDFDRVLDLRKIGVDRIIVTPMGPDSWEFRGQADFSGTLHRRSPDGPPKPPTLGSAPA